MVLNAGGSMAAARRARRWPEWFRDRGPQPRAASEPETPARITPSSVLANASGYDGFVNQPAWEPELVFRSAAPCEPVTQKPRRGGATNQDASEPPPDIARSPR